MHYNYLILGGGMTADAAATAIRESDEKSSIGLISAETNPPYKRPPLTKQLWKGKPEESIWLHTRDQDVQMHLGCRITNLDPKNKRLIDEQGAEYTFDKLLIATGGTPRRMSIDSPGVIYYRNFDDYRHLRALCGSGERFAVMGGGFIGSEIAAALAMNGKHPSMVFPDNGIGARVYPREISNFLIDYFRERGVEVFAGDIATAVEERGQKYIVRTQGGRELSVDGIVAGIGITPNVELASSAGIRTENGIVVERVPLHRPSRHLRLRRRRKLLQPGPGQAHTRGARGQRRNYGQVCRAHYGGPG